MSNKQDNSIKFLKVWNPTGQVIDEEQNEDPKPPGIVFCLLFAEPQTAKVPNMLEAFYERVFMDRKPKQTSRNISIRYAII